MRLCSVLCILFVSILFGVADEVPPVSYTPQHGDLVFQSLAHGAVIDAIEGCTGSPFSHCGIVVKKEGGWYVLEAIGPVQEKPLLRWIHQGRGKGFAVHRVKPELQKNVPAMIAQARRFLGRPYDIQYELDDAKIYCSELIYKGWLAATGQKMGKLVTLGSLKWQPHEQVIREIAHGLPLEREMITPRDLAAAPQLQSVLPLAAHRLNVPAAKKVGLLKK
ncbi:MAG: hypothetical protein IPK32_06720 [Verrucomicrobiaceae bacterium]|nr:hypothetical protein [Verrucomicrobiaceae bacterium]